MLQRIPLTTAALGVVALVLAFLIGRDVFFPPATNTASSVRTATVTQGTVRSVVTGTGSLVGLTTMNLGFKTAGTLTEVDIAVGQKVTAGQVLAKIDPTTLQLTLDQANSQLASAQANLQATLNGTALAQAQHGVAQAQQSYTDTVNSVNLTNAQDANQLSSDQNQYNADNAQLSADQSSPYYQQYSSDYQTAQSNYAAAQSQWYADRCNTSTPGPNCTADWNNLNNTQNAMSCLSSGQPAPGATPPGCTPQQQRESNAYKQEQADQAKVNADNSKIAADQSKVSADQLSGQQRINSAQNAITNAQDSLNNQSSQRPATIASQQAAVDSAQASVTTAQTNVNGATLTAPIDGTITTVNGNVGDSVNGSGTTTVTSTAGTTGSGTGSSAAGSSSGSSSAFAVLSNLGAFQIVAPFAEADASRVQLGQTATVTFDAIQNLVVPAHVVLVAPTSTVTSNVVNYNVTFAVDQTDPRLKSGMTSNVTVTVASANNVLVVPNSAVTRIGTRAFVTVIDKNGKQVRTPVQTGVSGDSTTQVTSGVAAGDRVVLPTLRTSTGTTTARGGFGGGGGGLGGGGGIRVGGG